MASGNERIDVVVAALEDDFFRQGGLDETDVLRLVDKHGLSASAAVEIARALEERGIAPHQTDEDGPTDERIFATGPKEPSDDSPTPKTDRRVKLLQHEEVVALARTIRLGEEAEAEARSGASEANEAELARFVEAGVEAKRKLAASNLGLVYAIAREYQGLSDLDLEELVQEGTLGLIRACEKFDHTLGYRFSTYAVWWVRQAVIRGIQNKGQTIRLPSHVHQHLVSIRRARNALELEFGRAPTTREIGEQVSLDAERVQFYLDMSRALDSLDRPLSIGSDLTLGESLAGSMPDSFESVASEEARFAIMSALDQLTPRDRKVLQERFGLDGHEEHTLEDIGTMLGLSRERIRQLQNRALERLRHVAGLREYAPAGWRSEESQQEKGS